MASSSRRRAMADSERAPGWRWVLSEREDLRAATWDLMEARRLRWRRVWDRRTRKRRKWVWMVRAAKSWSVCGGGGGGGEKRCFFGDGDRLEWA